MKDYITVVGGANIDISGTPKAPLKNFDSNPGKVGLSLGGVGRNICENLARLSQNTKMITVLGDDFYSKLILENAKQHNIDFSDSLVVSQNTSIYLCLNNHEGDMHIALSDMDILNSLTEEFLVSKLDVLNNSMAVVCDTNIPQCLKLLQKSCTAPLFLDTVSAKKTEIIKNDITNIFCVKANIYEAEILAEIKIENQTDLEKAIEILHQKGISWVVVTLGEKGVAFSSGNGVEYMPSLCKKVVNTTGAGDSFVAGLVYGYCNGYTLEKSVQFGSGASCVTIESEKTVSEQMSVENVLNKII